MNEEIKRNFATIGAVYEDGVTLIFDGEDDPTDKHYLCNTSVEFHAGDRVRIVECDGTYIVEYVVGPPGSGGGLPPGGAQFAVLQKASAADGDANWGAVDRTMGGVPSGGTAGQVLTKNSGDTYDTSWKDTNGIPAGGSTGQILQKTTTADFAAGWADAPHGLPTGGSVGQVLKKTSAANYAASWQNSEGLPTGGSSGQILQKNSSADFAASWVAAPHGIPTGGSTGQVLAKTSALDHAVGWTDAPKGLPTGGSADYILRKRSTTAGDAEWVRDAPAADAVVDQNTKSTYTQNKIYFRWYSNHFWARYGTTGTWTQIS